MVTQPPKNSWLNRNCSWTPGDPSKGRDAATALYPGPGDFSGFCLEEIEVLNGFDVNGISMISTMISTSNAWEFNDL